MNGCVIPHTPIAVDFWKVRECPHARIFFLTHLHGDHVTGLTSSWPYPIYCSEFTEKLLFERHGVRPELVHSLQIGCPEIIYLDGIKKEQMTVTVLDANHCPGAVMFLMEGYFGTILHTGDFRFTPDMIHDSYLEKYAGKIDVLYLDNTYCSPRCQFPTRDEATANIINIIEAHPSHDVLIAMRNLGKENLVCTIALHFCEWVYIPEKFCSTLKLLGAPDVFDSNSLEHRIRVIPFQKVSRRFVEKLNEEKPTIVIMPTALYVGIEAKPYESVDCVHIVPYSDHSSFSELEEFVSYLKPQQIIPVVKRTARGPFGLSIADRADMSVFSKFTGSNWKKTVEIPPSVQAFMNNSGLFSMKSGQLVIRRKSSIPVKHSQSKRPKRGVTYDSPNSGDEMEQSENDGENERNIPIVKQVSFTEKKKAVKSGNSNTKQEKGKGSIPSGSSKISNKTDNVRGSKVVTEKAKKNRIDRTVECLNTLNIDIMESQGFEPQLSTSFGFTEVEDSESEIQEDNVTHAVRNMGKEDAFNKMSGVEVYDGGAPRKKKGKIKESFGKILQKNVEEIEDWIADVSDKTIENGDTVQSKKSKSCSENKSQGKLVCKKKKSSSQRSFGNVLQKSVEEIENWIADVNEKIADVNEKKNDNGDTVQSKKSCSENKSPGTLVHKLVHRKKNAAQGMNDHNKDSTGVNEELNDTEVTHITETDESDVTVGEETEPSQSLLHADTRGKLLPNTGGNKSELSPQKNSSKPLTRKVVSEIKNHLPKGTSEEQMIERKKNMGDGKFEQMTLSQYFTKGKADSAHDLNDAIEKRSCEPDSSGDVVESQNFSSSSNGDLVGSPYFATKIVNDQTVREKEDSNELKDASKDIVVISSEEKGDTVDSLSDIIVEITDNNNTLKLSACLAKSSAYMKVSDDDDVCDSSLPELDIEQITSTPNLEQFSTADEYEDCREELLTSNIGSQDTFKTAEQGTSTTPPEMCRFSPLTSSRTQTVVRELSPVKPQRSVNNTGTEGRTNGRKKTYNLNVSSDSEKLSDWLEQPCMECELNAFRAAFRQYSLGEKQKQEKVVKLKHFVVEGVSRR